MDLSRGPLAVALVAALVVTAGCAAPRQVDRLVERPFDQIESARLSWEPGSGEVAALSVEIGAEGVRVRTPPLAPDRWRRISDGSSWLTSRAEGLVVWSFPAVLPSADPETIRLEAESRQLPPWPRPGEASAFGWFHSAGGFLSRGFYLALPEGEEPGALGLRAVFEPSRRLLIDLAGDGGSLAEPADLVGWVVRGGVHRRALFVPGRCAFSFGAKIPERSRLRFSVSRRTFAWVDDAPASELRVEWRDGEAWRLLDAVSFPDPPGASAEPGWTPYDLDLGELAGRANELRFRVASAGSAGRLAHFVAEPVIVAPGPAPRRRNLLVVIVDGLRADRVGAGGADSPTPNLDRLAARGLRFTNASAAAPWTRASVASLFTGRLPSAHGVETEGVDSRLPRSFPVLAEQLRGRGYATAAFSANPHLDPGFGLARGFSRVESQLVDGAVLERRMLDWLESREHEPFFLFGFFMDTHFPYADRPGDGEAESIAARVRNPQRLGRALERERKGIGDPSPEEVRKLEALYDENVRYADARIGALLERLRASGLDRDTVVAVLADHGEAFGEHGDFFHGWNLYRELEHVPLVVAGPGVPRGVRPAPTSLASLPALLLELIGVEDSALEDRELARGILAGRTGGPAPVVETRFRRTDFAALIEWPWKLLLGRRHGSVELYDLERDPGERNDRVGEEPERAERLRRELLARLARARAERVELDEPDPDLAETMQQLRALGYL